MKDLPEKLQQGMEMLTWDTYLPYVDYQRCNDLKENSTLDRNKPAPASHTKHIATLQHFALQANLRHGVRQQAA